jgi:hypothetical protein
MERIYGNVNLIGDTNMANISHEQVGWRKKTQHLIEVCELIIQPTPVVLNLSYSAHS